jgi:hypothetical protein
MNHFLAEMYGTGGAGEAAPDESAAKVAQMELFAKVAADNGVDLTKLTPDQVNALWSEVMPKLASEDEDEDDEEGDEDKAPPSEKKDEKKDEEKEEEKAAAALQAAALAEFEQQKEAQAKLAEAELMGQVMAHSFVRELNEIEKSAGAGEFAQKALNSVKDVAGKASGRAKGAVHAVAKAERGASQSLGDKVLKGINRAGSSLGAEKNVVNRTVANKRLAGRLTAGAGAAGVAGGAYAATRGKDKEASAFDTLAAENAIKMAAEAGYDVQEATDRLNALFTLGQVQDSQKVAFVDDPNAALHVRSLELLESIGAPVNWEEVFGG